MRVMKAYCECGRRATHAAYTGALGEPAFTCEACGLDDKWLWYPLTEFRRRSPYGLMQHRISGSWVDTMEADTRLMSDAKAPTKPRDTVGTLIEAE